MLLLILSACASYHPRGTVVSRVSETEGVMSVESASVEDGDKLLIKREVCRLGVRGYLDCRNVEVGTAVVEKRTQNFATFRTPAGTDFKKNDLLENARP